MQKEAEERFLETERRMGVVQVRNAIYVTKDTEIDLENASTDLGIVTREQTINPIKLNLPEVVI